MGGPLERLKVLDIATIIAAPFAATLLADYRAEVLKIEMPGQGDGVRSFPPFKDGKPLWWKTANRNKKFATLDLRTPEGLALFKQMLPRFTVDRAQLRNSASDVGQDNCEIYQDWLGLSEEQLDQLARRKVI
jgi:crotonobetainyl-CoA:carnitine CoA-transferase CaiB-like acyl-CoA transferase